MSDILFFSTGEFSDPDEINLVRGDKSETGRVSLNEREEISKLYKHLPTGKRERHSENSFEAAAEFTMASSCRNPSIKGKSGREIGCVDANTIMDCKVWETTFRRRPH